MLVTWNKEYVILQIKMSTSFLLHKRWKVGRATSKCLAAFKNPIFFSRTTFMVNYYYPTVFQWFLFLFLSSVTEKKNWFNNILKLYDIFIVWNIIPYKMHISIQRHVINTKIMVHHIRYLFQIFSEESSLYSKPNMHFL